MPKNKGKYAKDRAKEVVQPQEQIRSFGHKIYELARPHAAKIGALLGAMAVILVAWAIYSWAQTRRATKATKAFNSAIAEAQQRVGEGPQTLELDPNNPNLDLSKLNIQPPKYKTTKDRDDATLAKIHDLDRDYGSAGPAEEASLLKGSLLYDEGKYDDSIKAYQGYPAKGPLSFLAKEGMGYAQEAKALTQTDDAAKKAALADALKTFASIQPDEKGAHYDLAAYHQARVLAEQGDPAKAIDLYKKALAKNPPIDLATQIKTRLALLGDTSQQAQ